MTCPPIVSLTFLDVGERFLLIMFKLLFFISLVAGWCFVESWGAAQEVNLTNRPDGVVSFVSEFCIDCHQGTEPTAGLNLEDFGASFIKVEPDAQTDHRDWEKMVKRLRSRQMPPRDSDRPDESQYQLVIAGLETVLDQAARENPQPGRTESIRRLNRTEYRNAVRDLLALDVDMNASLPPDEAGHGFDNVTVGGLPPVLLSRYITAAERISQTAVGAAIHSPAGLIIRVPADQSQESHVEGLPLGTRGGTVFQYHFPASGEYEIQLRLARDRDERIEGLKGLHEIDVLIDRHLARRFNVSSQKSKPSSNQAYGEDDSSVEAGLKGRFVVDAGPHSVGVTFPEKSKSLAEIKRQPFDASFNRHRHPRREPAIFEVSIVGPLDSASYSNFEPMALATGDAASDTAATKPEASAYGSGGNASSTTRGMTPSQSRIFTCLPTKPDETLACAEKILARMMRLAYRRPISHDDLTVPMRFFETGMQHGGFETGIESALASVLVNPYFLFRSETQPNDLKAGSIYPVSDLELASRLSFFLWSSIPDDELLTIAEQGKLRQPDVLQGQVMRMLRDSRSQSLVTNFAAQWLYLRNLDSFRPDMRLFPDFDDNLRTALRRETELLFDWVVREDRSVLELISTNATFLNERLAKHYGIPHVIGSHFRPVLLSDSSSHRGGLLRHGSILAVTSYATRTSPTIRGNWILGNILGTPLPPPPPNVPALKDKAHAVSLSIRERLSEHRANPACASCHDLMDPIGFALENFDAVGRWRTFDEGRAVDATGELPDGTKIANFEELERSILKQPDMFVGTLVEKLMTFALGRGIESYDAPAVRQIIRDAAQQDYRFSSLINGIVSSVPFQMRVIE